jgi:hypothetical protein
MSKLYVTLLAIIGLVILVPSAPATGAATRKHQCTIKTRAGFLEEDYGYPNVGTSAEWAGVFDESCDGGKVTTHGASESRMTITNVSNAVGLFKTEETRYSDRGTLKMTTTGTATPQPESRFGIAGESRVTGGTRLYRGATGSGTFTGSIAPNGLTTTQATSTEVY